VLDTYRFYVLYLGVKKRKKTMNLETYLETNNITTTDLVNLFSVGTVLNKVSGDTFPMLPGGAIGFDEPMNLMDMDISDDSFDWYNSLAWGDREIVDEVMDDLSYDKYCENNPDFNAAMNGHPEYI
jgi:hypothetical protein